MLIVLPKKIDKKLSNKSQLGVPLVKALSYIPKYLNRLKFTDHEQAYPTTYLNQRYFDS